MLVVPILRATSPCTITAYTRQSTKMLDDEPLWDLRIKIAKMPAKQAANGWQVEQSDDVRAGNHRGGAAASMLEHTDLDAVAAESKPFDLSVLDLPEEGQERRSAGSAGSAKPVNVADLISQKLNAFRDEDD